MHRLLPMKDLQNLSDEGALVGLQSCGDLLGGAVIGLHDGSFWAPCVITGKGVELYANSEELGEPAPVLLPPVRPPTLCEGPGFIALAKPSGLRTEDALRFVQGQHPEAELVSRLDKQTSGCLVIATNPTSAAALTQQFAEGTVRKTYLALVWGEPDESGHIDAPLSLSDSGGGSRYRAYVSESGKSSSTFYRTLWKQNGVSLLAAFPKTGRTHQIRCHLAHIGFPLVGDSKYGGCSAEWCRRLPLHCLRVIARDVDGGTIDASARLTEDFEATLMDIDSQDNTANGWHQPLQTLLAVEDAVQT